MYLNKMLQRCSAFLRMLVRSIWMFPCVILLFLMLFTTLRLNQSSIGIYSSIEGKRKDPSLLFGGSRGIRADEWLVNTQLTVAQANNGFKRINNNLGNGLDSSLIVDVPYKEWSTLFKPQNISFFVLPLEHAFAFKWWSIIAVLAIASYLFVLEIMPDRRLLAILISVFLCLSPMVFWWYQSVTILSLAYSFLSALLVIKLFSSQSRKQKVTYSVGLAYVLICFALLLYPPFQIPCLLVTLSFLIGWFFEQYPAKKRFQKLASLWPYLAGVFLVVVSIGLLYIYTRKDAIHTITNTVYPGSREVASGGTEPILSFSSFLAPNFESDTRAASGFLGNQSEASNFIFIAPFLLLPSIYLIYKEWRRRKGLLWQLVIANATIVFFMSRMYLRTPWLDPMYRLLLLDKVPGPRLLIGLGLAGILQLIFLIVALYKVKLSKKETWVLALTGSLGGLSTMLYVGVFVVDHYPVFASGYLRIATYALWLACGIFLLFKKRIVPALIVLILFSALSVYKIHPLYRGLGPVTTSDTIQAIKSYPDDGSWVVLDNLMFINFPAMAGKHSLDSVQYYPELDLWHELDSSHKYENVYNRYAHVLFVNDSKQSEPFKLDSADTFDVRFEPCSKFAQSNIKYVLTESSILEDCLNLDKTIRLSSTVSMNIYIVSAPKH